MWKQSPTRQWFQCFGNDSVSFAVGPKYPKMDLHQVNEYPWLTIPRRSVNTTAALVSLLDNVFVSPVDSQVNEDIFLNDSRPVSMLYN